MSSVATPRAMLVLLLGRALGQSDSDMPPLRPLRAIAYGALPCLAPGCDHGRPSEDMLQEAYTEQWGADGRDDLGIMTRLGGNGVRLYHSLGSDSETEDHGGFLDHAQEVGLNVLPGYHTERAHYPGECPEWDCFDTWKKATLQGFASGFNRSSEWHPAVAMLILLNEPDFFDYSPKCEPKGPWCHTKAALSAMDGVLAAEREAGIEPGRVKLTVTWSFGMSTSIDGKLTGPGTFGFQDMVAAVTDPSICHYTPQSTQEQLNDAFATRWVHGLNTQAPWSFVRAMVSQVYDQFKPTPWFIGEYGANGQSEAVITKDLESMDADAAEVNGTFLGAGFFQFETALWKGGSETNFGLFTLGAEKLGEAGCDQKDTDCVPWPVMCLSPDLTWLPGSMGHRAQAVAAAWNGTMDLGRGMCGDGRRLLSQEVHV